MDIDHGPVRRGDPAVVGVGHLVVGIHAFAAVGAAVIDALPDGFVVEFAFDVVGQGYVVDYIAVAFEVFARGIKGVMRIKGIEGEGPGHAFFRTSADEGDGALDAIGGLAVFFRGECLYVSGVRERAGRRASGPCRATTGDSHWWAIWGLGRATRRIGHSRRLCGVLCRDTHWGLQTEMWSLPDRPHTYPAS